MIRLAPWISLIVLAAGCGGGPSEPGAADAEPAQDPAPALAAESAGRDLAAVDVCDLIPADAVAAAVGAESSAAPTATDPGFDGKGCRYEYRPGGGMRHHTEISLHPPAEFDFWRTMQSFKLQDLPGLGDGAYWGKRTGQTDLYVLKSNDVSVHIQARSQELEQAQAIAKAVLERL